MGWKTNSRTGGRFFSRGRSSVKSRVTIRKFGRFDYRVIKNGKSIAGSHDSYADAVAHYNVYK